jgi:hypothetical protein
MAEGGDPYAAVMAEMLGEEAFDILAPAAQPGSEIRSLQVDPAELRRRVGVALVGRATGPFRNQLDSWRELTRRRLELAEHWVGARPA